MQAMLRNCRIVLVRPRIAANIGAAARVMRNMGLHDLALVAPEADPSDRQAFQLSTHGEEILRQARITSAFDEAVADCTLVAATSARIGGLFRQQSVGAPEQIVPYILDALTAGKAALVFGPESSGLTNSEVSRCHYLIHIPADPSYPALNLAQAVAICLYELRRGWLGRTGSAYSGKQSTIDVAPVRDQERMFDHLQTALSEIHFLYGTNAESLMHALRHLIGRAGPSQMEVDVLLGLARQIRWYVAQHPREG
jgi:tRNA/rRNA methyltransferase